MWGVLYIGKEMHVESGYVYTGGKVHSFSIDWKESMEWLHWSKTPKQFLARATRAERKWLEDVLRRKR